MSHFPLVKKMKTDTYELVRLGYSTFKLTNLYASANNNLRLLFVITVRFATCGLNDIGFIN